MKIFSKKLNVEADNLIRKFDLTKKCYYYEITIDGQKTVVQFKDLDRISKKKLLLENYRLTHDNELMQKEIDRSYSHSRNLYLKSIGLPCISLECLGSIRGTITKELQVILDKFLEDKNSLLGVYRLYSEIDDNMLQDILEQGIVVESDSPQINSKTILKNTINYYPSNKTILKELMYANEYNNAVGSILIKIPDEDLNRNDDIIIESDGVLRINPKYIVGYIPVYPNNHLENIILGINYSEKISKGTR